MDTFESNDMNNNDGDLKEKIEHLGMELNNLKEANAALEMELKYLSIKSKPYIYDARSI